MTDRLAVLVNPRAGRGRHQAVTQAVSAFLRSCGYDVTVLEGASAAESAGLAKQAVVDGFGVLVVIGGDGIVHCALQSVAYSSTTLGVIATEVGNDVARLLGLPVGEPLAAAEAINSGTTRTVDLGRAGNRFYATVLAAGFDSSVNQRANKMRWATGRLRYTLATVAELGTFRPLRYLLELDGETRELEAMLVAVGNGPTYGGGLRMCEGAHPDDGYLDVVIIKPITRAELVKVYPRLFTGTHVTHPAYQHHRVKRVSISAPDTIAYADGEPVGPLPITVDVAPAALNVFAPR
ncbi:MAG: diacylglycerol/lipid kinase family protein [Nocardioidaceae bacterium]